MEAFLLLLEYWTVNINTAPRLIKFSTKSVYSWQFIKFVINPGVGWDQVITVFKAILDQFYNFAPKRSSITLKGLKIAWFLRIIILTEMISTINPQFPVSDGVITVDGDYSFTWGWGVCFFMFILFIFSKNT